MKNCVECKFCVFHDTGYSNYTVEGTDFICAENAHPDGTFDRYYGEDGRLDFAQKCPVRVPGDSVHMDVEGENEIDLTPQQKVIFVRAGGTLRG